MCAGMAAEGCERSAEGDGFAEGSQKLLRKQSAEYSFSIKKHHEETQAADKLCVRRPDDMMIVSETWRETSQKSEGPFEAMCPCHMLYRLKQQSMMSMGIFGSVYSRKHST